MEDWEIKRQQRRVEIQEYLNAIKMRNDKLRPRAEEQAVEMLDLLSDICTTLQGLLDTGVILDPSDAEDINELLDRWNTIRNKVYLSTAPIAPIIESSAEIVS